MKRLIINIIALSFIVVASGEAVAKKRVNCAKFETQKQAQKYWQARKRGWKGLDRDKDGEACECLPGGSGESSSTCKRWRKKYGR